MTFRIFTQYKSKLPEIVSRYFDGFTLTNSLGFYNGSPESSCIIDIDCSGIENPLSRMMSVIEDIKYECCQQEVLVQTIQCSSRYV